MTYSCPKFFEKQKICSIVNGLSTSLIILNKQQESQDNMTPIISLALVQCQLETPGLIRAFSTSGQGSFQQQQDYSLQYLQH